MVSQNTLTNVKKVKAKLVNPTIDEAYEIGASLLDIVVCCNVTTGIKVTEQRTSPRLTYLGIHLRCY